MISGYTGGLEPVDADIALECVEKLASHVIAEGGIRTLEQVQAAAAPVRTRVLAIDLSGTETVASLIKSGTILDTLVSATGRGGRRQVSPRLLQKRALPGRGDMWLPRG